MASLPRPHRLGRWAALGALTAVVLVLLPVTNAGAEVVRLRVDWAPADGRPTMHTPYLGATTGERSNGYPGPCSSPTDCGAGSGARWVEENLDAGGQPRTLSFVDETTTQYSRWSFTVAHPFAGFGPNIVGTATITHADGRSYTVPFDVPPGPSSGIPTFTPLGDSQGLPRPPRSPSGETCTISYLKQFAGGVKGYYRSLKGSVSEFARRWRTGARLLFNNVYACGTGKITGRVVRLGRERPFLIAKGTQTLDYAGPGRAGTKLKLTRTGRKLRAQGRTFRAKATIRVFDGYGASLTYSQTITLRDGQPPTTPRR